MAGVTRPEGSVKRAVQLGWLGLLAGCGEAAVEGDVEGVQCGLPRAWSSGAWPLPVGSGDTIAMWTHFRAACSLGKYPRALTARRILAFTDSIALVVQTMRRISVSNR
jgi:hypothetical protein